MEDFGNLERTRSLPQLALWPNGGLMASIGEPDLLAVWQMRSKAIATNSLQNLPNRQVDHRQHAKEKTNEFLAFEFGFLL